MSKWQETARNVINQEAEALTTMVGQINDQFDKAVELLHTQTGRVIITGVGKSGYIGQKVAASMCSTGTKAVFMHPVEALHGDFGIYDEGDPTLMITKSGATDELLRLLPILKKRHSSVVLITAVADAPIARKADAVLLAGVRREADDYNIVPTVSTTAALAMGDALTIALMKARRFTDQDFARNHPGGSLGRRLLSVQSVLHDIEKCAVVSPQATLQHIVQAMTEKSLGAALVQNSKNDLLGIVTEGDLRRALLRSSNIYKLQASDLMTARPVTILPDASISQALKVMEDRSKPISVLPVTNTENKCLGLIRIHDLYQPDL